MSEWSAEAREQAWLAWAREAYRTLKREHSPFVHDYARDEKKCPRCTLLARAPEGLK